MQEEHTVGAWAELWFTLNSGQWRASTVGGYRNLIFRHIIPGVGSVPLTELTSPLVSAFYEKLSADRLSSRSVWCVHLLLRRILDDACKSGIIEANPADRCEVPAAETKPGFQLRGSQIRRYLNAAQSAGVLPVIYIGLTVGLRQCELFTLSWADFDLQHRYILRGRRLLSLDKQALALLQTEHKRHPHSPYAFLNSKTGEPFCLHEFYYLHRKLSEQARLPRLGFRELQKQWKEMS